MGTDTTNTPNTPKRRPGRPGGKRDLNRKRQTQAIAEAALALFVAQGVEPVTIGEIAQSAGVAKGSFYRYFADKERLVAAVLTPLQQRLFEPMDACEEALRGAQTLGDLMLAFRELAAGLLPALLEHPLACRLYLLEARAPERGARAPIRRLADQLAARAHALTVNAQRLGVLQTIPPAVSSLAVIGAVERLLLAFLNGDEIGPVHELPGAVVGLIMGGLAGPGAQQF